MNMADHTWEDDVEPAVNAAVWVLERLYDTFTTLEDNGLSERKEFGMAAEETRSLISNLVEINNRCYNRREEDNEDEDVDKQFWEAYLMWSDGKWNTAFFFASTEDVVAEHIESEPEFEGVITFKIRDIDGQDMPEDIQVKRIDK
jgi:hypothetical protein